MSRYALASKIGYLCGSVAFGLLLSLCYGQNLITEWCGYPIRKIAGFDLNNMFLLGWLWVPISAIACVAPRKSEGTASEDDLFFLGSLLYVLFFAVLALGFLLQMVFPFGMAIVAWWGGCASWFVFPTFTLINIYLIVKVGRSSLAR